MAPQPETQTTATTVAVVCALPGTFLVFRKMPIMFDFITRTILLGIVLAFFITHDLSSPFLILGAALMGVATVQLTELLSRTRLLAEGATIGAVLPLLFSIAITLTTRYVRPVYLNTDSVLLEELAFAPFDRMIVGGVDIGVEAIYTTGVLLLIDLAMITLFFEELELAMFDSMLAAVMGFSPALAHYDLMTLVSPAAVGAFQAVGLVLVVASVIDPPITAYLLMDDLKRMLLLSGTIGAISGVLDYQLIALLSVSIIGSTVVITGLVLLPVFISALYKGLISALRRQSNQKAEFAEATLLFHLSNHEDSEEEAAEVGVDMIQVHLRWIPESTAKIIRLPEHEGNIRLPDDLARLTDEDRQTSIRNYNILFSR